MLSNEQASSESLLPPLKELRIAKASWLCDSGHQHSEPDSLLIEKLLKSIREDAEHIACLHTNREEVSISQEAELAEPMHTRMERVEQGFCAPMAQNNVMVQAIRGPNGIASAEIKHQGLCSSHGRIPAGVCGSSAHNGHLEVSMGLVALALDSLLNC